nr:retrovirus-related Pol polyprotein from transposon TNT 1-94 [Tanacetum cinerariifolium]
MHVVQIVLWYLDSGCSKHMTRDRSQLINFVQKFLGTVKFGNNHVAKIMGYGDYKIGNVIISRVYFMEGLGHNLFSVGQFCDSDLEVDFRQHTCFIRNLDGVDLLTGSQGNNLYTLSLQDMMASSPICLLSKALKTKSWLWHRRLSHLNFGAINHLARQGLVRGLPKLKFEKDHLYSACAMGKSKKKSHKLKSEDTNQEKLYLLHMDLCGPMRVESVNGKKYILCTFPTERTRSIISMVSISLEGFLPSILLLVVINVAVVIVAVILVVIVINAIVGVVIVVVSIGVVVVVMMIGIVMVDGGISHIIKLSFVIIGFLYIFVL